MYIAARMLHVDLPAQSSNGDLSMACFTRVTEILEGYSQEES